VAKRRTPSAKPPPQKPKGIPLLSLFLSEGFERNYKILMRENPGDQRLRDAITSELIAYAKKRGSI